MTAVPATEPTRTWTAFRILTLVFSLLVGFVFFGLISLVLGWFEGGDREIHRVHDLGWGAVGGAILTVGMLVQLRNPEARIAPMQQVVAAIVGLVAATLIAGELDGFVLIFLIIPALLLWLHPARAEVLRVGGRGFDPLLGGLAVLAAVPLFIYAFDQIDIQKLDVDHEHWEEGHFQTMAALAFALPLAGLIAALKAPGWLITARCVGAAAMVFGLASILYGPGEVPGTSSLGTGWGTVALLGGAAFIALAQWRATGETS